MTTEHSEIDPAIFGRDQELELTFMLATLATDYSTALAVIQRYEADNAPEAKAGRKKEMLESHEFKEIRDIVGNVLGSEIVNTSIEEISDPVKKGDYTAAVSTRETSVDRLVAYTFGYQQHMQANLETVFDEEQEATSAAWEATWNRLKQAVGAEQGIQLADIATLFDLLVADKYGPAYDPSDRLRGPIVSQDIAARTFYETMEDHLPRSILKRRSGDDWS